jgi:predicted transcriptional regulator
MPLSLRLPSDVEQMLLAYSAREGLSKSAVIVQSIRDFFEKQKPQPTAYDKETRPHKIAFHQAMQAKQARRQAQ